MLLGWVTSSCTYPSGCLHLIKWSSALTNWLLGQVPSKIRRSSLSQFGWIIRPHLSDFFKYHLRKWHWMALIQVISKTADEDRSSGHKGMKVWNCQGNKSLTDYGGSTSNINVSSIKYIGHFDLSTFSKAYFHFMSQKRCIVKDTCYA